MTRAHTDQMVVRVLRAELPERVTAAVVQEGSLLWVLLDVGNPDAERDARALVADWVNPPVLEFGL